MASYTCSLLSALSATQTTVWECFGFVIDSMFSTKSNIFGKLFIGNYVFLSVLMHSSIILCTRVFTLLIVLLIILYVKLTLGSVKVRCSSIRLYGMRKNLVFSRYSYAQPVKKFPAIYGTGLLVILITRFRHPPGPITNDESIPHPPDPKHFC